MRLTIEIVTHAITGTTAPFHGAFARQPRFLRYDLRRWRPHASEADIVTLQLRQAVEVDRVRCAQPLFVDARPDRLAAFDDQSIPQGGWVALDASGCAV